MLSREWAQFVLLFRGSPFHELVFSSFIGAIYAVYSGKSGGCFKLSLSPPEIIRHVEFPFFFIIVIVLESTNFNTPE